MKKLLVTAALVMAAPAVFAAGNNVGCGLGSAVWNGKSGVGPQVLAATTNGTSGNQTFGITFGTLGCTQDGVVSSSFKLGAFIDGNKVQLARDAAAGQGETLEALASLINVQDADKAEFNAAMKQQFARIFRDEQIAANLKEVLAANGRLAQYAATI